MCLIEESDVPSWSGSWVRFKGVMGLDENGSNCTLPKPKLLEDINPAVSPFYVASVLVARGVVFVIL